MTYQLYRVARTPWSSGTKMSAALMEKLVDFDEDTREDDLGDAVVHPAVVDRVINADENDVTYLLSITVEPRHAVAP